MTLKVEEATRPDDLIELGRVLGAHGIKGWVKIQPFSSDSSALASATKWWLADPQSPLAPNDAQASTFVPAPVVWGGLMAISFWPASRIRRIATVQRH